MDKRIGSGAVTVLCSTLRSNGKWMVVAKQFDGVYAIESIPHAPNRPALFKEVMRVLKPGAQFGGYDWCMTDLYNKDDETHQTIKHEIEAGDAMPETPHTSEVIQALEEAGFIVNDARDLAPLSDPETPWYLPLAGRDFSIKGLLCTRVGRRTTHIMVWTLEKLRLAPAGSTDVSRFLIRVADHLVAGGKSGIFTPMFYFRATKPK